MKTTAKQLRSFIRSVIIESGVVKESMPQQMTVKSWDEMMGTPQGEAARYFYEQQIAELEADGEDGKDVMKHAALHDKFIIDPAGTVYWYQGSAGMYDNVGAQDLTGMWDGADWATEPLPEDHPVIQFIQSAGF